MRSLAASRPLAGVSFERRPAGSLQPADAPPRVAALSHRPVCLTARCDLVFRVGPPVVSLRIASPGAPCRAGDAAATDAWLDDCTMDLPPLSSARDAKPPTIRDPALTTDAGLSAMSSLLANLDPASAAREPVALTELAYQNKLAQVRLGIASGLFATLRARHAPTAAHSLRVALGCSSWALFQDISDDERDEIEVAALLHDLGKVGVPDEILIKPGRLTAEESRIMDRHRQTGCEILQTCAASPMLLSILRNCGAHFDGTRPGYELEGEDLPLGARMLAIVDAFDAMTNDQVYRGALSRERSIAELFEHAGTQFDPRLVKDFCGFIGTHQATLQTVVAHRWLKQLQASSSNKMWLLREGPLAAGSDHGDSFQQQLLESMHDAVIFVDHSHRILLWNRAAERLTGISPASVEHQKWSPELIGLRDKSRQPVTAVNCPVFRAIRGGQLGIERMTITGRGSERLDVEAHVVPVRNQAGVGQGAALLLHDASSQISLEQRVLSLHEKATRDPLTQVSNRAEFDRIQEICVDSHQQRQVPCSLIMCDIDHFKLVNDTYGHQAGDEVLITFAALLQRHCRPGDLVARYGGEEFVLLCVDCNNAAATRRAEQLRTELSRMLHDALGAKTITASFGVTELQNGDTPETMLRRADRALYQAKEAGRNLVVQLGAGIGDEKPPRSQSSWLAWLCGSRPERILTRTLVTAVPLNVVVEKVRGFVADQSAQIESIGEDHLVLRIAGAESLFLRRTGDRDVPFLIELNFEESTSPPDGRGGNVVVRTVVRVTIRPQRGRDRRRNEALPRAQKLLASLKSYLIAHEYDGSVELLPVAPKK